MKNPTTKDLVVTASGFYRLPCNGEHDFAYHFYMYYSKQEIIKMWKSEHNQKTVMEKES
jgi:hypothetical protein